MADELDGMSREELKELVRLDDSLAEAVDLRSSTGEMREALREALGEPRAEAEGAPAPEAEAPAPPAPPKAAPARAAAATPDDGVQLYRVGTLCRWVLDGAVQQLAAGSIVSERTHPLDELRAQGVLLEAIDERPPAPPGVGHRFV